MRKRKLFNLLITLTWVIIVASSCQQQANNSSVESDTSTIDGNKQRHTPADTNSIAGNWVRTDATYRIEISAVSGDGTMKANYFNPKSINVSNARWSDKDGFLRMHIELRDVNYPGSKYNLSYIPERDMLAGEYYQAMEQVTYKVQFVRVK